MTLVVEPASISTGPLVFDALVAGPESAPLVLLLRARSAIRTPLGQIRVPTPCIRGDADDTVGRPAAPVTAEQMPQQVSELLLAHLARHPVLP